MKLEQTEESKALYACIRSYRDLNDKLESEVNKSYEMERELSVKYDELETLSSAYNDLKRGHSIVKQSLETHRDWLKSSDSEVVRLTKENKALLEQIAKIIRNTSKLSESLLWAKNKMRANGLEEWKLLNKGVGNDE